MSTDSLKGRVAVVTGASKGLGKAIAIALAEAGAQVALVARNREKLEQAAVVIRQSTRHAEVFLADVARDDDVSQLVSAVTARFPKIHILVNNAGINIRKKITEFPTEEWRRVIETNLVGPFLLPRINRIRSTRVAGCTASRRSSTDRDSRCLHAARDTIAILPGTYPLAGSITIIAGELSSGPE